MGRRDMFSLIFRAANMSRRNPISVYIRELSLGASDFASLRVQLCLLCAHSMAPRCLPPHFCCFLIEPIAAKEILPALGGSSAVWITCLVFFQGMLVLGYLYAHWLGGESLTRGVVKIAPSRIHLVLLAAAVVVAVVQLGIHPNLNDAARHPVTAIFLDLAGTIGLPFLLLASASPLLQLWFARREDSAVPYRLFGLSNAGSLLALLLYPVAIEPYLTLRHQKLAWSIGFVVVAVLHAVIVRQNKPLPRVSAEVAVERQRRRLMATTGAMPDSVADRENVRTARRAKWLWFLLPMVAAMQLSAVTGYISENIAAIPLLWILPLAAYLLSFIAAFDAPGLYRRGIVMRFLVVLLAALGYMLTKGDMSLPITINILFFLIEIFVSCYFLHAETYALRPARASEVTLFYLLIACGGVAGSFFIGIASPLIFNANYDIAISFAATAAVALAVIWSRWRRGLAAALSLDYRDDVDVRTADPDVSLGEVQHGLLTRNFYGSLRVRESHDPPEAVMVRSLQNGAVQHGTQWFAPQYRRNPTTYYARNSGVGLVLEYCCLDDGGNPRPKVVGVIGLGAGTLAAYGLPGDRFTFYEINPGVQPIARNLFRYIADSSAQVDVLEGDARITLESQPPQGYDVLVVDAFSGDAIPIHLLTREAIALYRKHLAPGGVILYHVSNQYLDLAPEVALLAASQGMRAAVIYSPPDNDGALSSTWVLVTKDMAILSQPQIAEAARPDHSPMAFVVLDGATPTMEGRLFESLADSAMEPLVIRSVSVSPEDTNCLDQ